MIQSSFNPMRAATTQTLRRRARTPEWWMLILVLAPVVVSAASVVGDSFTANGNPTARLSGADEASEYWDVTARLDSGYWLFARFMITNEGLGAQTGVGMGYLVLPDGRNMQFSYARRKGDWKLSADRLRLQIASSMLDLHAPVRQFEIDSNTRGIKVHLRFTVRGSAPGTADAADAQYGTDVLQVAVPVEGTLWVRGMREPIPVHGTTALTHTWMEENEARLTQRRIEFFAQMRDLGLYVSDLTTPEGTNRRWLVLERGGTVVHATRDFELSISGTAPIKADSRYAVPGLLRISDHTLVAEVRPERLLLRTNPLEGVPQPFRWLLEIKSQPQRLWVESSVQLTLTDQADATPNAAQGHGILAINFLNPMSSPNGERTKAP